jgi:uncharacterized protein
VSETNIKLGDYNKLKVAKAVTFGLYLESERGEILLPTKYVPEGVNPGDELEVFLYKDSEDRLIATTLKPKGKVGEFAALKVKDVAPSGAYLEWGLEKDLLVPFGEQHKKMNVGETHIVRIALDPKSERLIGIARLAPFLEKSNIDLRQGQQVDLLIYEKTDLGYMAIIDHKYSGMLYRNETFKPVQIGDRLKGYVKKLREDNKIDLELRKSGYQGIGSEREVLLKKLRQAGGYLPLHDKSDPKIIYSELGMSKKTFKQAVGSLFKERMLSMEPEGIRLIDDGE